MKRILCIVLALLLLTPAVFAAESMKLELTPSVNEAEIGDKVTYVGKVTGAPSCASFRVIATYDNTCLKLLSGSAGSGIAGSIALNKNATYQGKSAIVALAASASQALIGDAELFVLEFEVIGEPTSGNTTGLTVAHQEFFNEDLKKVTPAINAASITYPSLPVPENPPADDNTAGEDNNPSGDSNTTPDSGNNTTPDNGNNTTPDSGNNTTPDNSTDNNTPTTPDSGSTNPDDSVSPLPGGSVTEDAPSATPDNNDTAATPENGADNDAATAPGSTADPGTENTPSNAPTGNWIVAGNQFAHVDEEGNANLYEGEYKEEEPVNPGDKAEVILKDEEGKEIGSVVVEKDQDGSLNVVEQDLGNDKDKSPVWIWFVIGGAVVLVAATAVVGVFYFKKRKAVAAE
ncbi:MAG: hypothetical protein IJ407_05065 [Clostridia bacterium]|nr:hypothetical protein [Clostridia bacterium]